jgi:AAA15 family ATPase/GTPase
LIVYHPLVIRRLHVHNFRCLENFELPVSGLSSALLIGKNGCGKTTVGFALQLLQKIARGTNRVNELVKPKDFARGRSDVPMRFEIEAELEGGLYKYAIAFDLPIGEKELRVLEEKITVSGRPVYSREAGQVHREMESKPRSLKNLANATQADFPIDWHLVALPILQHQPTSDAISASGSPACLSCDRCPA